MVLAKVPHMVLHMPESGGIQVQVTLSLSVYYNELHKKAPVYLEDPVLGHSNYVKDTQI